MFIESGLFLNFFCIYKTLWTLTCFVETYTSVQAICITRDAYNLYFSPFSLDAPLVIIHWSSPKFISCVNTASTSTVSKVSLMMRTSVPRVNQRIKTCWNYWKPESITRIYTKLSIRNLKRPMMGSLWLRNILGGEFSTLTRWE